MEDRSERPKKRDTPSSSTELDKVFAQTKDEAPQDRGGLLAGDAQAQPAPARRRSPDPSGVEEFLKLAPKDSRAASLLATAAEVTKDERTKAALLERLNREYPGSDSAGCSASDSQTESIGKPFDLEFANAINGKPISMKDLKGKVVVIDFWATWCGPCVAEMPKMKELYAKYQDQGVEFIGVSLDQPKEQGGLDSLKKFVKEHEIAWPQYYQGDCWTASSPEVLGNQCDSVRVHR